MLPRSSWLERYLKVRRRCLVHYFCVALLCGCSVSDRHFQGALSFVCLAGCLFRGAASLLHRLFPKGDAVFGSTLRRTLVFFSYLLRFCLILFLLTLPPDSGFAMALLVFFFAYGILACHRTGKGKAGFLSLPFCLALLAFSVFSNSQLQAISVHSRFFGLMLGTFGTLRG